MSGLEYFVVESPEATGKAYYERIAGDVLQDLNLLQVVEKLHITVDPKVPLFVAVGVTRKLPSQVRVRDFAAVVPLESRITLSIGDETYLAPLLTLLWDRYGKAEVDQPDRFTVVVTAPGVTAQEIEDLVVLDPTGSLYRDLMYALICIQPEGFKVRKQSYGDGRFFFVASEDTLPEDVVQTIVAEKFRLIGVEL
ncbi:MAG: methanogenesis marker 17 protein [Methanomicrobiales archaeon]|nr:methanogenesis marker 17 protein [Methanomicrobiales archaeon]